MSETNLLGEEFKMLVRASRNERFRFIIIQYNHFSLIEKVKKTLLETYSDRKSCSINLDKIDQKDFIQNILNCEKGFVFIEEFQNLLAEDFRSLAIGFNQRRDKFSEYPITIIAFLPTGEKYLQQCQTIMPDIFSLVNPIIQLNQEKLIIIKENQISNNKNYNFKNYKEAEFEILKIEQRLKTLEKIPENLNLRVSLISRICEAFVFNGQYKKALFTFSNFLNSNEKTKLSNLQISTIFNDLGVIYSILGNYKKALSFNLKALELKLINKDDRVELYTNLSNIGECYRKLDKTNKALEYSLNALKEYESFEANQEQKPTFIYNNLGIIYEDLLDFTKANMYYEKGLKLQIKYLGEVNMDVAISYNNLAGLYLRQNEFEKAQNLNFKVLDIRLKIHSENHHSIANSYNNIGAVYSHLEDNEKAKYYYLKAKKILLETLGEEHPEIKLVNKNIILLNL